MLDKQHVKNVAFSYLFFKIHDDSPFSTFQELCPSTGLHGTRTSCLSTEDKILRSMELVMYIHMVR